MKKILFFLSVLMPLGTYAAKFEVIDDDFQAFMNRLVLKENHESFKNFYDEYMPKLQKLKQIDRAKELKNLREQARCSLAIKHPDWAQYFEPWYEHEEINFNNNELKKVRTFLVRYAIHEEYLKTIAINTSSLWCKAKQYTKQMTTKISKWMGSLKSKQAIT